MCKNEMEAQAQLKCLTSQIKFSCEEIKNLMRADAQGRDAVFQKVLTALEGMCTILELIKDLLYVLQKLIHINSG